jgi:predicted Fe-Mo cluster-binding NifX family protein
MRIVVPLIEKQGESSRLSPHFGRAPFFGIVDIESNGTYKIEIERNQSSHFGGMGRPSDNIIKFKPQVVVTYGMGIRAINLFNQYNIKVFKAVGQILKDNIEAFIHNDLTALDEECKDAHHK